MKVVFGPWKVFIATRSVTEKVIPSILQPFTVLPQKSSIDDRGVCTPGLRNPEPSGFYYQDVWQSRVCRNRLFPAPSNVTACLTGKVIYMFGDSTTQQWWQYLVQFLPSLQKIDLHIHSQGPPLLAIDIEHRFILRWRAHQRPLTMTRIPIQEIQYIANELNRIGGHEGLVVVINCLAHFVTFPVSVYVRRIRGIRDAVVRLLERSPQTKVFIKSGNTGYMYIHGSDWLSLQLDMVMRAIFSGLPVTLLDTWEMTSCHYLPRNLHPEKIIVKNELDLMLSFICPQ
ncbi:hypothetical protein FKM82_005700 [Ascaphus truei]